MDIIADDDNPATTPRKRGRPQVTPLEPFKDKIIQLFSVDDLPIIEIARKLNLDHGLDISERTISRRLSSKGFFYLSSFSSHRDSTDS